PEGERHCGGFVEKILDPAAEEDGNGEGAVIAEGDEERQIQIEGDVEIVRDGDSENEAGRECKAVLCPSDASADVGEGVEAPIDGVCTRDDGIAVVLAQEIREHPWREPEAEVVPRALQQRGLEVALHLDALKGGPDIALVVVVVG